MFEKKSDFWIGLFPFLLTATGIDLFIGHYLDAGILVVLGSLMYYIIHRREK